MDRDVSAEQEDRIEEITRFAVRLGLAVTFLALLPALIGWLSAPTGSLYFGIQTNLDDHMVYAAWMRQAMEGRFLMDNRFAIDPQPGLTVHVYFFALGLVAKLVGIPAAMAISRAVFTFGFVYLLSRLLIRLNMRVFEAKFGLIFASFGGGLGFLFWERFGQAAVNGSRTVATLVSGRAPIDVWQPEAFVFPSALTNGLFMASLCLMVTVFNAVLSARDSWKGVLGGALAYGVLMNIHSYDVLLIAIVLVGFLVTQLVSKQATWPWVGRVLVIGLGALPSALWFLYVLQHDPVFQMRAATPTYSANFQQVLFGILPPVFLALVALYKCGGERKPFATLGLSGLLLALYVLARPHDPGQGYFLTLGPWIAVFIVALGLLALLAKADAGWNLIWSWAILGLVAIYFPALFERKLSMGLVVPWAILASLSLPQILTHRDRSTRNLVAALALVMTCAVSILWFQREIVFIRKDVSSTTVHSVYYSQDAVRVLEEIDRAPGRKVVVAMPGIPNPVGPADFDTPILADLNSIISGMTGAYTFAGHWSETPDYGRRRTLATLLFLSTTSDADRKAILREIKPDFIVAPNPVAFENQKFAGETLPLADLRPYGEVVYEGSQLFLVRYRP
ncbi:MAG: hypothetical protein KIT11_01060 [Fimbriimonadaceae bacterium]|nr:hypothetical protein [Fimbriimonadaceae bacterium]QYK55037.1 MAG: hypothetical protein KF733_08475 [Fimbriimonadaceae bacterium]